MPWYKDPLFGIVLLFLIIAIIGAIDFIRNRLKERRRTHSLENLKKSYEFLGIKDGVEEFLRLNQNATPTLEFIAQAYIQSGNLQEAIKIYTSILNSTAAPQDKERILYALGVAHFQAGFLQRAKNTFLEILKNSPRDSASLLYLLRVYEKLNEYQNAIDVVDCLQEIYEQSGNIDDTKYLESLEQNRAYLRTMHLFGDEKMSFEDKIAELEALRERFVRLEKSILVYYKHYNLALFWQKAQESRNIENLLDVFWRTPDTEIPVEILTNPKIIEVYKARGLIESSATGGVIESSESQQRDSGFVCARSGVSGDLLPASDKQERSSCNEIIESSATGGVIESSESQQALDSVNKGFANKGAVCAKFELEAVRLLRTHTPFNADLHFEYRCSECKEIFPLESHRCPTCNALLSFEVLCSVRESRNEARYSLL